MIKIREFIYVGIVAITTTVALNYLGATESNDSTPPVHSQIQSDQEEGGELRKIYWEDLSPPVDEAMVQQYREGKLEREVVVEYMKKLGTTPVQALNNQLVEIPGYLVPLDLNKNQKANELLLVPTLGACIHVPPPPPNQTIYVRFKQGIEVTEAGYTPYVVQGRLLVENNTSEYTDTVYSIEASSIKEWE